MNPFKRTLLQLTVTAALFPSFSLMAATPAPADATLPEVQVSGAKDDDSGAIFKTPTKTNTIVATPVTKVRKADIDKTNAVTTADAIKYESGIFARQRYIGDPNAPVGMRGSSPYEAGRVMVFMDGMPIWNPLQSSYNGSPRFGLIGPGEIKSVDVLGGPFNAEYSGNSMGGVINYNTVTPTKREIYTEATYMLQPSNISGINTNLQGFKTFGSYADKFDKFTTYFSYNHLENEGQPMTPTEQTTLSKATAAQLLNSTTGAQLQLNPKGNGTGGAAGAPMIQVGSDGVTHTIDDLYKWKGGYEITPDLKTNLVLAYENLEVSKVGQSLVTNAAGQTVWGSQLAGYSANGMGLTNQTAFGKSDQQRETFTVGWGLNGKVSGNWYNNTNVSYFDVLNDTTVSSNYNPNDPAYKAGGTGLAGSRTSVAGTGWYTVTTKFNNDEFLGRKDLSFATGYDYQHARLLQTTNTLSNSASNTISSSAPIASLSGGTTDSHALFGQLSWRFLKDWDATPGVRLEHWGMSDGLYQTAANMTGSLSPKDRDINNWAPKFSLGYQPGNWKFRYSVAKAYRYPVADELFGNSASTQASGGSFANSTLKPEDGTHHNLLGEYDFENGYVRLNLFHENIQNAIYSQYIYIPGASTLSSVMSSIGEVQTNGLDISTQFDRVLKSNFDVKVNSTMLDATIVANPLNPALVGNQMPLLPHYRANMLTTYHYGKDLDMSVGTRYQSAMNSQPDNKDLQLTYYGAFTQSVFVDLKTTYHFNDKKGHVSAGIDNVNGYQAYFNHPFPQRTYFMQVGYKF
ncbi:MAG: TonB-dependent receptor [Methylococcales bacterium]|nr:MAG: TonB-dependent receptor [Methylococcales bacterium]